MTGQQLLTDTTPASPPSAPPTLGPVELARWAWRQLTSMRTALVLLFCLALAAVPGSLVPQQRVDPLAVRAFALEHPSLAPVFDRIGLFDVYSSPWFSAIYLLLMISLIGCVVPRTRVYWRALRSRPPRAPRHLSRLPVHRSWPADAPPEQVAAAAAGALSARRYRIELYPEQDGAMVVAAERGHLREAGNLIFHGALIAVLVGTALGSLYGFKGGMIVTEGQGFANVLTQYDEFSPGGWFDPADLPPFALTVRSFDATFQQDGPQRGTPLAFSAEIAYTREPGADPLRYDLRVNHPLQIDGTSVFLIGHGYAPDITVRDGTGRVVFSGPVTFLPQDASLTSYGVVKAPDAAPRQLGFEGFFLPTFDFHPTAGPISTFPDARNPALVLLAYAGDLGLDDGLPQSVYELDRAGLTRLRSPDGDPFRMLLQPGDTRRLPDGAGSITFSGLDRWVKLQVSQTPGKVVPLVGVLVAILGLLATLFVRPRRAWVRARPQAGRTVVEIGGLDRTAGGDLAGEVDALVEKLRRDRTEEGAQ